MTRKIVVVGGGAGGCSAASSARKTDRKAEITLIDMHKDIGYSRCGLPFVGGEIPSYKDLTVYGHDFFKMSKIDTLLETTVTQIEPKGKSVIVKDNSGSERTLENKNINASFHGLNFNIHTGAHVLRAAQEGIVFAFNYGLDIMSKMGLKISKIRAGYSNMFLSPIFQEVLSSLSDLEIELYNLGDKHARYSENYDRIIIKFAEKYDREGC